LRRMRYCNPLGRTMVPGFLALSARKAAFAAGLSASSAARAGAPSKATKTVSHFIIAPFFARATKGSMPFGFCGKSRHHGRNFMAENQGAKMRKLLAIAAAALLLAPLAEAQPAREKIIIDTDIGDDIDDAFAVALALSSPQFEVLGFSASFGDTPTRVKMLDRMLGELGHSDIPVAMGTPVDVNRNAFTQRRYAEGGQFARATHPSSVEFVLDRARKYPHQVTLVAIGPLPNVGAMIAKDPAAFRLLKKVVIMGGSIRTMTDPYGVAAPIAPHPEWNIKNDIAGAQKLFESGVPLQVLPLDSTANLKMHEVARTALFAHGSMMTNILA